MAKEREASENMLAPANKMAKGSLLRGLGRKPRFRLALERRFFHAWNVTPCEIHSTQIGFFGDEGNDMTDRLSYMGKRPASKH